MPHLPQGFGLDLPDPLPRDIEFYADFFKRLGFAIEEAEALDVAREVVAQLGLPVKVVIAEYTFDGQRLTLLYVCDEKKVDAGGLVQRVQNRLGVRVELRRIGPRDHAKLMGGYGACGELRCCSRFLSEFNPVSIKMAKTQGVSLNPSDITGLCGRLRCCLMYEHEQYIEAKKTLPKRGKMVTTPRGDGKVVRLNPLSQRISVDLGEAGIQEFDSEEVERTR